MDGIDEEHDAPARPQDIPVAAFQAMAVDAGGTLNPARALANSRLGYALKDKVLEDTPLKSVKWATLHGYMHRRFGPPHVGGGGHVLTAGWILTTPDPDTFVEISPAVSGGPGFSIIPHVIGEDKRMVLSDERQAAVAAAYRATLIDLLRPVRVDSVEINALGEADRYDPALGADEEGYNPLLLDEHPSCGYATPLGTCDGPAWMRLWSLVADLGGGDAVGGRDAVIAMLMERAIAALAGEPEPVRLLVTAHLRGDDADRCLAGLGPTDAERAEAREIRAALDNAWAQGELLPMRDLDDADVARATSLLDTLGMPTPIMNALERRRAQVRNRAFAERFLSLGTFPESALPRTILASHGEVLGLPERLRAAGRTLQADLVEAMLGEPDGDGPVYGLLQRAWYDAGGGPVR